MTIKVFDFFSGCGGTSCGFANAGLDIVFALDIDKDSIDTFKENFPKANTIVSDIRVVKPELLTPFIKRRDTPLLFCGCAPCQPFSKQNKYLTSTDPRRSLLFEFARFVKYWRPEYVIVENVPGMQRLKEIGPFDEFVDMLNMMGYAVSSDVVPAAAFGVPQKRNRLLMIASLNGEVGLPEPTHGPSIGRPYSAVRDWIEGLPPIKAGQVCSIDADHQAAGLSKLNLSRIRITPEGGGRECWPESLKLRCHKSHNGHSDVYGRLHWDKPASGLTTKCISYSNGRFGHPEQDRALSIREAACLQTFPRHYRFKGGLQSKARQIGNAVPPLMAKKIAEHILAIEKKSVAKLKNIEYANKKIS